MASAEINLYQLVNEIFIADGLAAKMKNNQLVNNVGANVLLYIDKQVIKFILRNLVSNSNKFTENGSITVTALQQVNKTEITITDTGIGMSADKAEQLFTQTGGTTTLGTNNEKGSGLGLMLVKEFIDQLKGSIHVESTPGKGTKFIISIKSLA